MTSADCSQFVVTTNFSVYETSSSKRNHFRLIYLLYLRLELRAILNFVLVQKLIRFKYALHTVSVRLAEVLPPTYFKLRLTTDALVFGQQFLPPSLQRTSIAKLFRMPSAHTRAPNISKMFGAFIITFQTTYPISPTMPPHIVTGCILEENTL